MLPKSSTNRRALLIQLARLGDLVQSLPAIEALRQRYPERPLDLLCSAPLAPLCEQFEAIGRLIPWDGARWRAWTDQWPCDPLATLRSIETYLDALGQAGYDRVYNLNQHARGILMAHLFTNHSLGMDQARTADQEVNAWAQYLRQVAQDRGENRVHLADAWCGMCGVRPRGCAPRLGKPDSELPADLLPIGKRKGPWIALVVGAGDSARCVPPATWASWIREFLAQRDEGQVVLIGSGLEREAGQAILDGTPHLLQGRVWDATGRTTLTQLVSLLGRCAWTVGADTGPLHLASAAGSRALGLYFARARVHETGPYGEGHWVYQHATPNPPDNWPIKESIELICEGNRQSPSGWSLWKSHLDQWGVFFDDGSVGQAVDVQRAAVWQALSPTRDESVAA